MPFKIIKNDITKMKTDAIVNSTNINLQMGGGVCGAIFDAAGPEKLQKECNNIGKINVGEAVITCGYKLDAKHIIHTAGPIWKGGNYNEENLLYNAYKSSLNLALKNNIKSISFPLKSSGTCGYPKYDVLRIAISAIREFLLEHEMAVYLVVHRKDTVLLGKGAFSKIEKYIDDNHAKGINTKSIGHKPHNMLFKYLAYGMAPLKKGRKFWVILKQSGKTFSEMLIKKRGKFRGVSKWERKTFTKLPIKEEFETVMKQAVGSVAGMLIEVKAVGKLEDVLKHAGETFSEMLFRLVDEKGITDTEAYKNANVDRRLFSKIRSRKNYNPSKVTVIAFAISLKPNLDETRGLLRSAGYALSPGSRFDLIIEYYIGEGNYDIYELNNVLFSFDQKLLGA